MTSPADKIKEHLKKWMGVESNSSYPITKSHFYESNSATHRKAIEKLVDALEKISIHKEFGHAHYQHIGLEPPQAFVAKRVLAEVAEMLGGESK